MNIEVYANSLVQDIMVAGNADADDAAKEYYPAYKKEDGTPVESINTLGLDLSGGTGGETGEGKTCTVTFNGTDAQSEEGYFTFGDDSNKHNFNTKFTGTYNGITFTQGLKMEGTTLVQFTTTAPSSTVIIVQSTWSDHSLKFDGTELDVTTAATPADSEGVRVYTIAGVGAGTHKITRGSGESGLFYVEVRELGTTHVSTPAAAVGSKTVEYYTLQGSRISTPGHGVVIQVTRHPDGTKEVRKIATK
jgi:hypothetical protein